MPTSSDFCIFLVISYAQITPNFKQLHQEKYPNEILELQDISVLGKAVGHSVLL
nr:MAG TPA: hypothetical protein [Caudoviricetes sp.]DAS04464.1 MAG TPA: hypothetical protein [Caudoviricetes sp.]